MKPQVPNVKNLKRILFNMNFKKIWSNKKIITGKLVEKRLLMYKRKRKSRFKFICRKQTNHFYTTYFFESILIPYTFNLK